jgi:hypothetical protein
LDLFDGSPRAFGVIKDNKSLSLGFEIFLGDNIDDVSEL